MQKGLAPLLPRCQLEPRMQEVLSKCRHGGAGPLGHLGDTAGGGTGGKGATMWPPRGPRPHVCFSLGHRLPRFLMFLSVVRAAWWGGGRARRDRKDERDVTLSWMSLSRVVYSKDAGSELLRFQLRMRKFS